MTIPPAPLSSIPFTFNSWLTSVAIGFPLTVVCLDLQNAFDATEALNTGKLLPRAGVDPQFEAFTEKIKEIDDELKQHLKDMRKQFGCEVSVVVVVM